MSVRSLHLYPEVQTLLEQIECELKHAGLWSQQPPAPEALASRAPFCMDTMPLEVWLQFVFLPRMYQFVEHQHPLPSRIAITPIAEQSFSGSQRAVKGLMWSIRALDQLLESQSP